MEPMFAFNGQPTEEHERVLSAMSGQRITSVRYLLVGGGDEEIEDWDFVRWHRATMGVELGLAAGDTYTVTWMQYPGQFGVQAFPRRHWSSVEGIVDVTATPQWAPLLEEPVEAAARYDMAPQLVDGPLPVLAVRLRTTKGTAWLASAVEKEWATPDGELWGPSDDVAVIFDTAIAARMGIE